MANRLMDLEQQGITPDSEFYKAIMATKRSFKDTMPLIGIPLYYWSESQTPKRGMYLIGFWNVDDYTPHSAEYWTYVGSVAEYLNIPYKSPLIKMLECIESCKD